jgi:hypothetical protein
MWCFPVADLSGGAPERTRVGRLHPLLTPFDRAQGFARRAHERGDNAAQLHRPSSRMAPRSSNLTGHSSVRSSNVTASGPRTFLTPSTRLSPKKWTSRLAAPLHELSVTPASKTVYPSICEEIDDAAGPKSVYPCPRALRWSGLVVPQTGSQAAHSTTALPS